MLFLLKLFQSLLSYVSVYMWLRSLTLPSASTMAVLYISSGFLFWVDPMALFWESSLVAMLVDGDGKSLWFLCALCHVPLFLPCGYQLETFCCWTLSCSFFLSRVTCGWQQMEHHCDKNEWELYNFSVHLLHVIELYLCLALSFLQTKWWTQLLSSESCWHPEPCCSSHAPQISQNCFTITLLLNLILQFKNRLIMKICRFTCCSSWYTLQNGYEKRHLF